MSSRAPVLVLGANGLIGSSVVDELVAAGRRVRAFDRFGREPVHAQATLASDRLEIVQADLGDAEAIASAMAGCAEVLDFVWHGVPSTADDDPLTDLNDNVHTALTLLELAVQAGIERFYFASSGGAVYGEQDPGRALREHDTPLPISPYAIGKLTVEHYLRYYRIRRGLHSVSLRISNPYGPRQRRGRVQGLIPIVFERILAGAPIDRSGDGSMVRDFLRVEDCAAMIARMVGANPRHEVYNIAAGTGHSVNEVLATASAVSGRALEIVERPAPATFAKRSVLDISRYIEEFGMPEITGLEHGMSEFWRELNAAR